MWKDLPTFSQRLFVDTEQEFEAWRSSIEERYGAFKEEDKIALPATERTKAKRDATTANPPSTTADKREPDIVETLLPDKWSKSTIQTYMTMFALHGRLTSLE